MSVGLITLFAIIVLTIAVLLIFFLVDYGCEVFEQYSQNKRISCSYNTLKQLLSQLINITNAVDFSDSLLLFRTNYEKFTLFRYGIKVEKGYSSKLLYTNFFSIIKWWILLIRIKHSLNKKLKEKKINAISSLSVDTIFSDVTLSSTEIKETLHQIINPNNHSTESQDSPELEEIVGFKILK